MTAVDTILALERFIQDNAQAFALVTVDKRSSDVVHATGPFEQPEQALVEAGIEDENWRAQASTEDEADALSFYVVPFWGPTP